MGDKYLELVSVYDSNDGKGLRSCLDGLAPLTTDTKFVAWSCVERNRWDLVKLLITMIPAYAKVLKHDRTLLMALAQTKPNYANLIDNSHEEENGDSKAPPMSPSSRSPHAHKPTLSAQECLQITQKLVSAGTPIDYQPNMSVTGRVGKRRSALMIATQLHNHPCASVLLQAKANVNLKSYGYTALHYAAQAGDCVLTQALINAGADLGK